VGGRADVKAAIDNARQSIIINAMLADYVKKNPVKDADIKAEYDKAKAGAPDKEYHARHILVEKEDDAKAIITKLKGGAKFDELAKQSKDPGSAAQGGDLGWTDPTRFVPEFSKALMALKAGAITDTPVKTQYGYHVIKLEETRPVTIPPLEQVKQQVAEQLQQRKLAEFRESLLKKAKVQ
jgi:peptidyl-prolyl cis-trans isomerase C